MPNNVSKEKRSAIMSSIKGKDTKPELLTRKALFRRGLRYRLHSKQLPGSPDLVFPKYGTVLFVHGCFWHGHEGCKKAKIPQVNSEFWEEKQKKNRTRDKKNIRLLEECGWRVIVLWECELPSRKSDAEAFWDDLANLIKNERKE